MKSTVGAHRNLVREFITYNNKKSSINILRLKSITEFGQSLELVYLITERQDAITPNIRSFS